MKVLSVMAERCIGCRICEQWCAERHEQEPSKSHIHVQRLHAEYRNLPKVCHQCEESPCIKNCHFGALSKHPETGAIQVDEGKCTGCRLCAKNCPYDAIGYSSKIRKVHICDLCNGQPQCVIHCPEGVLQYTERNEGRQFTETNAGLWAEKGGFKV
ncbi:4Fe-4S dicluster domain-containing protein [Desulfitobacterium sp. AusDCA]|uniref:4Fe-4S dicluster domain-containing protein n=1 Tax=Desulfitobacterium sp. AusDCA TaxID=3240383 RepID=UPI003DA7696D